MIIEHLMLCKKCRHIFKQAIPTDSCLINPVRCPKCESEEVMKAPAWAPLGAGFNIYEGNTWDYECQQCKHVFTMPIPKSPSEGKSRKCPECGNGHLHLLTKIGGQPLYCG
jgi:Zn finger protein HypA/HybF involved in hydrogenase expression